jgi:acetyl esterase/lipase
MTYWPLVSCISNFCKKKAAVLFLLFAINHIANAQSCCGDHLDPIYSATSLQLVNYASNLTTANGGSFNGSARVWSPQIDTCSRRPLILFIHGGGFTAGYPELMDSLCKAFAQRGYVTAGISYRLGWIGSTTCPLDSAETYRAWYRAVQDCKTAIRFFRSAALQLGIDTSAVFIAGWSAGAYAAIGAAYCDRESEKPSVCGALPPLSWNGTSYLRTDLGSPSDGPYQEFSSKVNGVVSMAASVFEPQQLIQGANPPLLVFNNTLDPYAIPINTCSAWWNYDNCPVFPDACGLSGITEILQSADIEYEHVVYSNAACAHNMHDPCFPHWQDEVDRMATFFHSQLSCSVLLGQTSPNTEEKSAACVVLPPGSLLFQEKDTVTIFDYMGRLVSKSGYAPYQKGMYMALTETGIVRFLVAE